MDWKIYLGFLTSCPVSSVVPTCIIWKWFTGITKPIFYFSFCSCCFRKLCRKDHTRGLKNGVGIGMGTWFLSSLDGFFHFFKKCTCLWYCLSSEMITAPLLYWYNIVHASVVFLYSSLKFINLYCRCYVFLWQTSLQKFFKVFFNLFFSFGGKVCSTK